MNHGAVFGADFCASGWRSHERAEKGAREQTGARYDELLSG